MSNCPKTSKERAYKAIVVPMLEYGMPAWNPSAVQLKDSLEKCERELPDGLMKQILSGVFNLPTMASF